MTYHLLTMSQSQRMALIDIITTVMWPPVKVQVFVDVVRGTETTPADLLQLVMGAPALPESADVCALCGHDDRRDGDGT